MLTANIPASVFNVLVAAFFIVVLLGVILGAYAAIQLRKCQDQLRAYTEGDAKTSAATVTTEAKPEA